MKNLHTNNTSKILYIFIIKSLITSILSVVLFSFISAEIVYKLDLDLNSCNSISIIILTICSFLISFISVYGIKNNGALFGILSQIPVLFYMIINLIFHDSSILLFFIKLTIIILVGCLSGILSCKQSRKIRVR